MKIELNNISKSYNGISVIDNLSYVFESGKPVVIEGESGIGKTTLLRIVEGLEEADAGKVVFDGAHEACRFAPVFQETRLIASLDAVANVKLACPELTEDKIVSELTKLIAQEEIHKKISELSGGTARRVEIVRAVLAPSDVLIMDEPLTGLDEENAARAVSYIRGNIGSRVFITSSHSPLFHSFCQTLRLGTVLNVKVKSGAEY